jgi:hypothetical protein
MSNEEFERKMEFIVEQQAQFASNMQQLRGGPRTVLTRSSPRLVRL